MITSLSMTRSSLTQRSLPALVAVALVFSLLPAAAPAAAQSCQAQHVVQRGENLFRIGLKYNLVWTRIADANGITKPETIYAGQVLCIPASSSGGSQTGGDVKYVQAYADVNIRKGPGTNFGVITVLAAGQTAKVTGKSADGKWWRVVCPDGTSGECYITADPTLTAPASAPGSGTAQPGTGRVPTITVTAVVKDQTVTIQGQDFPAGEAFDVRMGKIGTQGVNGIRVTGFNTAQSGSFTGTFNIPAELRGQTQIAIRLESKSGYYSYNWFWNNSTN